MGFEECYQLGNVTKTHGLRGEVVLFLDVDNPQEYQELESVFIDLNGKLVPFFMESFHLQGDRAIVAFEEIESIDDASELIGRDLYLPLNRLPKLPKGKYYYHELPGLQVFDGDQLLGQVTQVYQMPNNNLLAVDHQGIEILIPLEEAIVHTVDIAAGKILCTLPDGLLDVYLDQKP